MIFKKIKKKEYSQYKGKVYDLTVEDTHSYNIDNLIVHNSAAGSLVCYALGITKVDPLQYDLLFERFLNQDRGHLPDIDVDFCTREGYKVFNHIVETYGKEYCANIITFQTMQVKSIIKDIARVMGIPSAQANAFTTSLPDKINDEDLSVDLLLKSDNPEHKAFFDKMPLFKKYAKLFDNLPRSTGQHAAGIGVSSVKITEVIPVIKGKANENVTDDLNVAIFEKDNLEHAGIIKYDILKLSSSTMLHDMVNMVKEVYNINIDLNNISLDDNKAWDLIDNGDTLGVFQFGSPIGIDVTKKARPRNLEELSACNAFIRPGASGLNDYIKGKAGGSIKQREPRIDKILKPTYGSIVYQEQIMQLISTMLDIPFGKADIIRRALEKPKKGKNAKIVEQFKNDIRVKSIENGFSPQLAKEMEIAIIENSGYGFNKCLTGDTVILGYNTSISELYKTKAFENAISITEEEIPVDNKIIDIYYQGVKYVYELCTVSNRIVRCTFNHRLYTNNGMKYLFSIRANIDKIGVLVGNNIVFEQIRSIRELGYADVYDVEMKQPYHNFVLSNGIISHNSHAVCYSLISYQMAWFKVNYPLVFYTIMANEHNGDDIMLYLNEAKKHNIKILPPDINKSQLQTCIEGDGIRIGFNALKGIGEASACKIVNNQPINSMQDLINNKIVNKATFNALANVNALCSLNVTNNNNTTLTPIQAIKLYELYEQQGNAKNQCVKVPLIAIKPALAKEYKLVREKDNTYIIPKNKLSLFNIQNQSFIETSAKPKGIFSDNDDKFVAAFNDNMNELLQITEDDISLYLRSKTITSYAVVEHPILASNKLSLIQSKLDKNNRSDYVSEIRNNSSFRFLGILSKDEITTGKRNEQNHKITLSGIREDITFTIWEREYQHLDIKYSDGFGVNKRLFLNQIYLFKLMKNDKGYINYMAIESCTKQNDDKNF